MTKKWIFFSVFTSCFKGINPLITLWLSKQLIDAIAEAIQHNNVSYSHAFWILLTQVLISIFSSVLRKTQELLDRSVEIKLSHDLQKTISKKTSTVPLAYYDLPEFHNHMERINGMQGGRFLSPLKGIFSLAESVITTSSFLVFLISTHWILTIFSVLAALPIMILQTKYSKERFWFHYTQTPLARETNYITKLLNEREFAKEIRLFGLQHYLLERWSSKYNKNAFESLKLLRKEKHSQIALDGITAIFYACSVGIIIWLAKRKTLTIGDFVAIGQAVQGTQQSINQISMLLASYYEENLYIKDFFDFLNFKHDSYDCNSNDQQSEFSFHEKISLKNVSFRYPDEANYTLKNISFDIKKGEKIAIVGENGSGKTTLVKCLQGLYEITEGKIFVDNTDLKEINKDMLRDNITAIFQDFVKYPFSVSENIGFGNVKKLNDMDKIKMVSVMSGADSFIQKMPNGYETNLGQLFADGLDLSGGQWQKIALSRALYRAGQVVILDEPTSALDPKAEMEVFSDFQYLVKDKTVIFISHRLAAARMADRILVLKSGALIEDGNHLQLMRLQGEYYKMFKVQARWYVEEEVDSKVMEDSRWSSSV
ncbi:ABC transporter ATP-binding protein [Brevibacillus fortis]|uniref:ABC transporter ATP-binding protein n=1 Tax=Brevibacillus fortis TaxID=2126352 RepID=UPI0038FD3F2A